MGLYLRSAGKSKSIGLAFLPPLDHKKRTAPGFFWSTREITALEHKKGQSEEKGSRTIYVSSHRAHFSQNKDLYPENRKFFIYYFTVCRKKKKTSHNNVWISFSSTAVRRLQIKPLSFSLYYQL